MSVRRDPETGQFTTGRRGFDSIETLHSSVELSSDPVEYSANTDESFSNGQVFEGLELVDWGEILDRNEVGEVIHAHHRVVPYVQAPSNDLVGQATLRAAIQLSASPARQAITATPNIVDMTLIDDQGQAPGSAFDLPLVFEPSGQNDTRDIIGPNLLAVYHHGFEDRDLTNGVGIGGGPQTLPAEWEGTPPDFVVDDRDEVYVNGAVEAQFLSSTPGMVLRVEVDTYYVVGLRERST